MRDKYIKHGLDSFSDHEILELLLFFAIPRINVNPLAHDLIAKFGSLAAVFDADINALKGVKGVGESAAVLIKLFHDIKPKYALSKKLRTKISDPTQAMNFCKKLFTDFTNEQFYVICLNDKNEIIQCDMLKKGSASKIDVELSEIARITSNCKAQYIILSHNHTGASCTPSNDDIVFTKNAIDAFIYLNVEVLDHVIVSQNDIVSFADLGLMDSLNTKSANEHLEKFYEFNKVTNQEQPSASAGNLTNKDIAKLRPVYNVKQRKSSSPIVQDLQRIIDLL